MTERLVFVGSPASSTQWIGHLTELGHPVVQAATLRTALQALRDSEFDLLMIDVGDITAVMLHRVTHAAARKHNAPFVLLLANSAGAAPADARYDELMVRPFTPRRLGGVIRKLLNSRRTFVVQVGPLTLDRRTHLVRAPKGLIQLTPKQFQLLDYLAQNPGTIITRRQIMQEVWDTTYLGDTRTLDVHIRWLRESLEEDPDNSRFIRTFRGRGYCLDVEGPPVVGGDPLLLEPQAGVNGSTAA